MRTRRQQRGVALIMAVLIVALAVILATQIGFDSALEQRRSTTVLSLDQGFLMGLGAEAWAASYLRQDFKDDPTVDRPDEQWATPIPPIPVDGGKIEGRIEDLQGRFNLNNLVRRTTDNKFVKNQVACDRFKRLLELIDLEPKWADLLADWLDSDTNPNVTDGAEDDVYTSQEPPYRAGNGPIASISELLALPDFGPERYRKLKPYVAALPIDTGINVCTAPGAVLDSMLSGEQTYSLLSLEEMAKRRNNGCFPTKSEFEAVAVRADMSQEMQNELKKTIQQTSQYFRATILVTIGTTEFTLYSLLRRESDGSVRPIMRSFGTD